MIFDGTIKWYPVVTSEIGCYNQGEGRGRVIGSKRVVCYREDRVVCVIESEMVCYREG